MQKILVTTLLLATNLLLTTSFATATLRPTAKPTPTPTKLAQDLPTEQENQQKVQQTAKNITVRITAENNGGSGVIVAQKGNTYLILTNAHVVRRSTQLQVQAPDGRKYPARLVDGGFSPKYDLALLTIDSTSKYQLPDLSDLSKIDVNSRNIYSTGYPFDSNDLRITSGQVSQLSDIPFDDGTQIGYITDKGKQGIRQGMSGGPIFDAAGHLLGINAVGAAPILPDYTYNDGSKPLAKLVAKYRQANWGIPIYNFLTNVKADILYGYDNLPKVERQVTPTGYLAKLSIKARQMTVRIENSGGNGSGVIVAKEGGSYYVLTAKHVIRGVKTSQNFSNSQIITYDQDRHNTTATVIAEGVDLAVVKFSSNSNYPLARIADYSQNERKLVFVGGYPGREKINSPLWQWQLNPGVLAEPESGKIATQEQQSFSEGYDLIYSSLSYGGMSGGPLFDTAGNVIGIHGKAEGIDGAILGMSLGISIQSFLGISAKLQLPPQLLTTTNASPIEPSPGELKDVSASLLNIPQPQAGDEGKRWLAYGNQLYRTFQYAPSVAAFDRAIAKGEILAGNYGKALSLMYSNKYQLAESSIAQAIATIPSNKRSEYYYFWKYQSLIFGRSGQYDEALKAVNLAISLNQNDLLLLNLKAQILNRKQQYTEAIAIFDEIVRKQPEVYAYVNRGISKSALGNKQGSIVDFDRAILLAPKLAPAYYIRGIAKSDLGDKQGAIVDFDRAILLAPKLAPAYLGRSAVKSDLGDKQGAIVDFDRAISLAPRSAAAYLAGRGTGRLARGDKQGAIVDFDRAILLDPKFAPAYAGRGTAKYNSGDKQGAIVDFDRAILLAPKFAPTYVGRGIAKSDLGDKQGAIVDLNRAILLAPQFAPAYAGRGVMKSDLGDKQGAIIDISKAAELFRQQEQMDLYKQSIGYLEEIKKR